MPKKEIVVDEAFEGVMKIVAKKGDTNGRGYTMNTNKFGLDFGMVAISGNIYANLSGTEYKVTLTRVK